MDMIDNIKTMVWNGKVLDDQGAWVPLAQRMEVEKKILDQLSAGKVLCEGRWVPIRQAKEAAIRGGGIAPPQETRSLGKRRAPRTL